MNVTCKRKRQIILCFTWFFLLLTVPAWAEALKASSDRQPFWEVKGGKGQVYLMGALHFGTPEFFPLDQAILAAFESSEFLVVELIADDKQHLIQAYVKQYGIYEKNDSLNQNLSDSTVRKLSQFLGKRNLHLSQFQQMKPWLVSLSLGVNEMERMGMKSEHGIDRYFITKAKGNKKILELESALSQIKAVLSDSAEVDEIGLLVSLDQLENAQEEFDLMVDLWNRGDANGLAEYAKSPAKAYPQLKDLVYNMLDRRNFPIVEKIVSYLESPHSYFVVIGAAHYGGENGILDLLEKKGYQIQPVLRAGSTR